MSTFSIVIVALLAISEVLALIPAVGSNSVFQLIVSILKRFAPAIGGLFKKKKVEENKEETK